MKKDQKDLDKKDGQGKAAKVKKLSDAEAQKLLNAIKEDRKKYTKQKLRKIYGDRYQSGKDW